MVILIKNIKLEHKTLERFEWKIKNRKNIYGVSVTLYSSNLSQNKEREVINIVNKYIDN